jgi:hypothetical protein
MKMRKYKIAIYTPVTHSEIIRNVLFKSGAGKFGEYDSCSFSAKGIGRFRGSKKTKPYIGRPGQVEMVEEEKIETIVASDKLKPTYDAVKAAHPYEEPAIDVYQLIDVESLLE